jgi:hypothetical protein
MSYAHDVLDRTARKLDIAVDARLEQTKRDLVAMKRADAVEREQRRDEVRRHADRCRRHQELYDRAFSAHGMKAQPPRADSFPPDYRRELFKRGQDLLSSDHPLTGFDPEDIGGDAIASLSRSPTRKAKPRAATIFHHPARRCVK